MQRRESYLYVGMDLHKKTHTAVLVNCWNEKIETLVIENKPVEFEKLVKRVNRKAMTLGLRPFTDWKTPMATDGASRSFSLKRAV